MEKGLIIWSGGLDSTSLLFHLKGNMDISAVHFSYGSKHNPREEERVQAMAKEFNIPTTFIQLQFIGKLFKSNLLESGDAIPHGHYADENMKQTVVPFRNGIMLSIAAGLAESMNIQSVYIGAHAGDHTIYPDCRPNFIAQMAGAIKYGTWDNISLFAPFSEMSKGDIVKIGHEAMTPFGSTYTCYEGGDLHCGKCGACVERREAFQLAGVKDPTIYQPTNQSINPDGVQGNEGFGKI